MDIMFLNMPINNKNLDRPILPKTIFARDEYIESLLIDLCKKLKIYLRVEGNLDAIDEFVREFYRFR